MKNPLIETPRLLASVLEKERELSAFARRLMGWGDGPVYFVGSPVSYPACLTAAAAFESVVGMPAMARLEPGFLAYSLPSLRPRALVFVIPPVAEVEEMLGAVRTLVSASGSDSAESSLVSVIRGMLSAVNTFSGTRCVSFFRSIPWAFAAMVA